jgi:hypothetical protein
MSSFLMETFIGGGSKMKHREGQGRIEKWRRGRFMFA